MLKYFSVFSRSLVEDENGQGFYLEFVYLLCIWKPNLNAFWACLPFALLFW